MMAAPDQGVRAQIEAVKAHLLAEGLTDILEPPSSKEGYHSFRSMYDKRLRLLWISYQWQAACLLDQCLGYAEQIAREAHGYGMPALMARAPLRAASRTSPAFGHLSPSAPTMSKVFSNQSYNDSAS